MIDGREYMSGYYDAVWNTADDLLIWINSCPAETLKDFRSELYKYLMELKPSASTGITRT